MLAVRIVLWLVRTLFRTRTDLVLENLALRQQLIVLRRVRQRPRLQREDRVFWLWLARSWKAWQQALMLLKPEIPCWSVRERSHFSLFRLGDRA